MTMDREIQAERIRKALTGRAYEEKPMFGGLTFMDRGNMLCCLSKQGLMVRVGAKAEAEALSRPHAAPCMGTGRPMAGFITVEPEGFRSDRDLKNWLALAHAYVGQLPPKAARPKRKGAKK